MLSLFRPRLVAVTLRATRLSSSMSSSSSSPSPLLLPSHIALIINRTLDKHHRSTYHLLERERVHYRASGSKLAPSIVHLLVLIEKLESDHLHHVKLEPYHNVHKRKNSVNYIEPLIFHAILSLYLLQSGASLLNPVGNAGAFPRDIALIQHDQLRSIVDQYNGARPKNQIVASDALTLSNMPVSADSRCSEHVANLSIAISLILQIFPNYSLANDIVPWIQTIAAPSVTQSCHALSNMTDIPPFLLMDILTRTPMNKEEFYLQKQIWLEYQVELLTAYKDQMKLHRQCMEQLIYYGLEYDPQTLVPILQVAFQVNNKGFKNSLFGKTFLNKLIWNILYNSMRSIHPPYSNPSENNITKAQECVVTQLSKQFPRSTKPHMNLELKGYMGIVLAIQKMSTVKAKKLLEIAEQQYNPDHSDNLNFSDINSYHFTKIALAESPDQLLYSFNVAADNISHVAMIWFAFISKLDEFGLLNDGRSVKILDQLLAKGSNILITKDIMLRLLKPITNLHAMEKFLTMIESSNSNLLKYHASSILPKYLRLVYNKTSQKNSQSFKRPKYVPSIVCKGNDISKNLPFIEYCRLVYSLIDRKTANIVGIHLFGESDLQPENIYSLYQEELLNFQVTEECLAALIRASMNNTVSGDCIQWGEMYAPQVAIHEFSKHVMKNKEENAKLYPSDTLWRRYIGMLSKYQYISQLSQIIEWWEAIDFIPSAECLMDLLVALPEGFGERHVKHYEKVVANEPIKRLHSRTVIAPISSISDWNWPTESELIHVRNLKKNQ